MLLHRWMIDITEFICTLELICECYLTGKKTESRCLCEQHICVFTGKVVLVICQDYCVKGAFDLK